MSIKIEKQVQELMVAINENAKRASATEATADTALKFTQAAVNAANAICTLDCFRRSMEDGQKNNG